jgi:integrase
LTGARLSEIAGLRRQDVLLDGEVSYVNFVEYKERTLKTKNSRRTVPLVPIASKALKIHLDGHADDVVFPNYNNGVEVNGNGASSVIVGIIKRLGIVDKTIHHARHTMRDLLRHAHVPPHIIDSIGGWGSNSVGESYGRGYSLKQKLEALNKALIPILG